VGYFVAFCCGEVLCCVEAQGHMSTKGYMGPR
jgi:hypothetical protein